ncbi:MAG TPA: helix-turn-helix transcriptional regulator [Firmicutes bacterium]|nr:helix-turn-helix transcriptional regulator [Bacillales bacterium]HJA41144.1 helix-turn-helix transcriptional regulator [Bacillota bacterium]
MKKDLYGACPFVTTQKILQGKWAILILHYLSDGPVRFNALQKMVPNMTHATLSKQLKQLEAYNLIIRKEYPQIPPKVEYDLSEVGKNFLPVLDSIKDFGNKYIDYLQTRQ